MEMRYGDSEIRLEGNKILLKKKKKKGSLILNPVSKEAPNWGVTYWREEACEKYTDSVEQIRLQGHGICFPLHLSGCFPSVSQQQLLTLFSSSDGGFL